MLGLSPATALNGSAAFKENTFEQKVAYALKSGDMIAALREKGLVQFAAWYDGLIICLFISTFFYRFTRPDLNRLRWGMALSAGLLLVLASFFGEETFRLMHIFWPVILLYAVAFFYILLDRWNFQLTIVEKGATVLFILVHALPLVLTLLPPRAGVPYPPYYIPFLTAHTSHLLEPAEVMCSDIPWATAWYGDRTSVLLPAEVDDFYYINDTYKQISGLYMTTVTRDKPFVSSLATGAYKSWMPILMQGPIPDAFHLNQGFPLQHKDQVFLTDRQRWE